MEYFLQKDPNIAVQEGPFSKDELKSNLGKCHVGDYWRVYWGDNSWMLATDFSRTGALTSPRPTIASEENTESELLKNGSKLVSCPMCEKQISPEAPACPQCGHPMKGQEVVQAAAQVQIEQAHAQIEQVKRTNYWLKIIGVVLLILLFKFVFRLF